jgi:hypothetical protein
MALFLIEHRDNFSHFYRVAQENGFIKMNKNERLLNLNEALAVSIESTYVCVFL